MVSEAWPSSDQPTSIIAFEYPAPGMSAKFRKNRKIPAKITSTFMILNTISISKSIA